MFRGMCNVVFISHHTHRTNDFSLYICIDNCRHEVQALRFLSTLFFSFLLLLYQIFPAISQPKLQLSVRILNMFHIFTSSLKLVLLLLRVEAGFLFFCCLNELFFISYNIEPSIARYVHVRCIGTYCFPSNDSFVSYSFSLV